MAIGVTLNSGVENWSFFELPPPLRFRIGVVIDGPGFDCSIFNSIRSFVLLDPAPDSMDVDGSAPDFVFIAILWMDFVIVVVVESFRFCDKFLLQAIIYLDLNNKSTAISIQCTILSLYAASKTCNLVAVSEPLTTYFNQFRLFNFLLYIFVGTVYQ